MRAGSRILIAGGGIGGLAAAIGLGRHGIVCDLVEAKADWVVYGVGLIQPGNAIRAYQALGVGDACIARGFFYTRQRRYDEDGTLLFERELPRIEGLDVVGTCGIPRPALHEILSGEALRLGTQVRLATRIAAIDNGPNGADVVFSDGSAGRYDLVIGAEGAYSTLRSMVFGAEYVPRFTGQGCFRATIAKPPEMDYSSEYHGPNKAGLIPLTADSMYIFVTTPEPGNPWMDPDQLAPLMRARLHGHLGIIGEIRDAIQDSTQVVYKPLEFLLMPNPWYRDRVVLIGDAAHTTTPHNAQGAAMAVEDAVVLADELAASDDIAAALARFMDRRWNRAQLVVEASAQIAAWELAPTATSRQDAIDLAARVRLELGRPI